MHQQFFHTCHLNASLQLHVIGMWVERGHSVVRRMGVAQSCRGLLNNAHMLCARDSVKIPSARPSPAPPDLPCRTPHQYSI